MHHSGGWMLTAEKAVHAGARHNSVLKFAVNLKLILKNKAFHPAKKKEAPSTSQILSTTDF